MGYAMLEVSPVGPPEYPLIAVLHESIFGRPETIAALRGPTDDLLTLMAHLEGNPTGYLVAHALPQRSGYIIQSIGILPDYRRQGLGTRMLQWAQQHARAGGHTELLMCGPAEGVDPAPLDCWARRNGLTYDTALGLYRQPIALPTTPLTISAARASERPTCPICGVIGVEKKQKWFCPQCGQLILTCCD